MRKISKKESTKIRGVTLISLVTTIVVLLILSGITISAVFSNDGIIKKAQEAANATKEAAKNDQYAINELLNEMDSIMNGTGGGNVPITGSINGKITWSTGSATLTLTTDVEGVTIQYRKNSETSWTSYTSAIPSLLHGDKIYARGIKDGETVINEKEFKIQDTKVPTVTITNTSSTTNSISATATAIDNESGMGSSPKYTFYIKKTAEVDSAYMQIENTTNTSVTKGELEQNTSYTIKVEVADLAGNKGQATKEVTTGKIADAEGGLTKGAIIASSPVWINGTASITLSTNSGLTIQYQKNGISGSWTAGTNVTGLHHKDIVFARLTDGKSYGREASITIQDTIAPTVTIAKTSGTTNSISATATATDNETGLASSPQYTFYIKKTTEADSTYTQIGSSTSTSITKGELEQNTSYTIKVEVEDLAGNKGQATKEVTTGKIADAEEGIANGAIIASSPVWSDGTASVTLSTSSGLKIQYQDLTKGQMLSDDWKIYESEITGLKNGDTIYARLYDGTNVGKAASVTIIDAIKPKLEISTDDIGTNNINVSAIATDEESGLAEGETYKYYLNNELKGSNSEGKYNFTNLNNDTEYEIKIIVTDKANNTTEKKINVRTKREIIELNVTVDTKTIMDQITAVTKVTNNVGEVTYKYYIKKSSQPDSAYELRHTGKENSYTFGKLEAFSSYTVKVEAEDENGNVGQAIGHAGTACFLPGTQIYTKDGMRNIEDIKIGDMVYTINLDNNAKELQKVIDVLKNKTDETYELTINNQLVKTTPRHQFYIVDKGWIRAYDLQIGDRIVAKDNSSLVIEKIEHKFHKEPIDVYNLTIENNHNYLITPYELLVHNAPSVVNPGEVIETVFDLNIEKEVNKSVIVVNVSNKEKIQSIELLNKNDKRTYEPMKSIVEERFEIFENGNYTIQVTYGNGDTQEKSIEVSNLVINPIAKIGEQKYDKLEEAIQAANENETIEILENFKQNVTITNRKDIILDLKGHTIDFTKGIIDNYGNLQIISSTNEGIINNHNTEKNDFIVNHSNLIVKSCQLTSENSTVILNDGTLTINKGQIISSSEQEPVILNNGEKIDIISGIVKSEKGQAIYNNKGNIKIDNSEILSEGTGEYTIAIVNYGNGTIELNGGKVISNISAIYNTTSGKINIIGTEIESNSTESVTLGNDGNGTITITSGVIRANNNTIYNRSDGEIIINDGEIIGTGESYPTIYNNIDGKVTINNGTIKSIENNTYSILNKGELNIFGGIIEGHGSSAIRAELDSTNIIRGGEITSDNKTAIYNESTKELQINNATVVSNGEGSVIVNKGNGNIIIDNSNISSDFGCPINNILNGNITIRSGNITTKGNKKTAIWNESGNILILGGKISAKANSIYNNNSSAKVTIGEDDNIVSTDVPELVSPNNYYTVWSSNIEFYDGILKGGGIDTNNTSLSIPQGKELLKNTSQEIYYTILN